MILTDIDGVKFEIDPLMINGFISKRKDGMICTEVSTIMNDNLLVKETPAQIYNMITTLRKVQP